MNFELTDEKRWWRNLFRAGSQAERRPARPLGTCYRERRLV